MKNWFGVFCIFFILGLTVYFNSLNNRFIIDDFAFLENPVLSQSKYLFSQWDPYREQALGVEDSQQHLGYYRPMAHMLLDFSYSTFKKNYWQYHLFNIFLFVLASSLVFELIEKLTGNYSLAFLSGLFYLVHPINGIIVNYISAQVFAFQVIFMLGTILLLLASLEKKNNRTLYFLSLLFSFLSLFWNESGIMTTLYVVAVVILFKKDTFKQKTVYLFPYFLIIFSYIIFRLYFISINEFIFKKINLYHMNGGEFLASLFQVYAWYIGQLFYPCGIVMQWAMPVTHDHLFASILGLCLLVILFCLLLVKYSRERICQLGLAWLFIGFIPVCSAAFRIPEHGVVIEPHWFVFSSIGFFILMAYFCCIFAGRMKQWGWLISVAVILAWGSVSHAYNQLWFDQKTYAQYWIQQDPYLKSTYIYLAQAYERENDLRHVEKYLRMGLEGYPSDMDVYVNFAALETTKGHYKKAESYCEKALKINPYSATAYSNLGAIYFNEGRFEKAAANFNRALTLNPFLGPPRFGLAGIALRQSDYKKAVRYCLENLEFKPDDPESLDLLLQIYIFENDRGSLMKYAYRLIDALNDPEKLTKLGIKMSQKGFPQIALDCFVKAIREAPDYKDAYLAAGTLLANRGAYDKALHIWEMGLNIDPSDGRFKDDIAKAQTLELK